MQTELSPWPGARMLWPAIWALGVALLLSVPLPCFGQNEDVRRLWTEGAIDRVPKWQALDRPRGERVSAISYEGMPFRGKTTRVFAWLGIPELPAGERAPAMVLVHGGGGTAFEEWVRLWVDRGYVAIAMDTCGQVPIGSYGKWFRDEQGGPAGWGGFDQVDWPMEDQWTFQAVADVLLAHSLVRSLPQVDPDRAGLTGISWGGYLACIVAGVDPRFKMAVPVYGCGFYRDTVFLANLARLGPGKAARWFDLWDASVYLAGARMPFLWVTGSNDFAYPLNALQQSYRLAAGSRTLCVRLRMPHGHGPAGEGPKEIHAFADAILKGGTGLPLITGSGREGNTAWVAYESKTPVVKAELNYTKDEGRWQDRRWDALPAERNGARFTATLPESARVYYFNLFDARDCVVSTEHVELSPQSERRVVPRARQR